MILGRLHDTRCENTLSRRNGKDCQNSRMGIDEMRIIIKSLLNIQLRGKSLFGDPSCKTESLRVNVELDFNLTVERKNNYWQ